MDYPVTLKVEYPEKLSRLTTFFRAFTAIPIAIILSLVSSGGQPGGEQMGGATIMALLDL